MCERLIGLLLIPAIIAGQNAHLSKAVWSLLAKPRTGNARLTWADGRIENGYVSRVTGQFVTFMMSPKPPGSTCENVELSNVAALQWLPASHSGDNFAAVGLLGAALSVGFSAHAVANTFRRMSPPMEPLRGSWDAAHPPTGLISSSLEFEGSSVRLSELRIKQGRYSINGKTLHMSVDGLTEVVTPFSFNCNELIFDNPAEKFGHWSRENYVAAPIVGMWLGASSKLEFERDGGFKETILVRDIGSVEKTGSVRRIHWLDSKGPGGADWILEIEHHHLLARVGSVNRIYRYAPPAFHVDL